MPPPRKPRHSMGFLAYAGSPGSALPGMDIPEGETVWEGPRPEVGSLRSSWLAGGRMVGNPAEGSSWLVCAVPVRLGWATGECDLGPHALKGQA